MVSSHSKVFLLTSIAVFTSLQLTSNIATAEDIGRGKYYGYVAKDRWNRYFFHTGPYHLMLSDEVAKDMKKFTGKPLQINVTKIQQLINPNGAIITEVNDVLIKGILNGLKLSITPARTHVPQGKGLKLTLSMQNISEKPEILLPGTLALCLVTREPFSNDKIGYKDNDGRAYWYYNYTYFLQNNFENRQRIACRRIILPLTGKQIINKGTGIQLRTEKHTYKGLLGVEPEGAPFYDGQLIIEPGAAFTSEYTATKELPSGEYEIFFYIDSGNLSYPVGPMSERIAFDVVDSIAAERTSNIVNLGRLGITRVSASSVNGNRPLSDKHYGALNLFDDGSNFVNNINYTYWLTDAQPRHWVKLTFLKPVTLHSVVVETSGKRRPQEYALDLSRTTEHTKRIIEYYDSIPIKGFRTTYKLPQPVPDVTEATIIFPGPDIIEVSEIKLLGQAPQWINLTPQKPLIALSDYESQGPHIIKVQRIIRAENDMRMITIAENTYPPREEVLRAIEIAHFKLKATPPDKKLWWYSEFDQVRIPYAITADAIDYYTNLVEGYRRRNWRSDLEPSSRFTYSVEVAFRKHYEKDERKFRNVYVVEMKLSMNATFASLAAIGFTKDRTVVLDRQGTVLAIFGDGKTPTVVS